MQTAIHNERGERLAYTYVEGCARSREVVVIGHGLTSDRDRPWSRALSAALAQRGLASLRPAFSGNGDSQGSFLDSTISKEFGDLGAVLDALTDRRLAYIGHSMGAAVGVLRAARDARIEVLVSLAGMVHTANFYRRLFGELADGELLLGKPGRPLGPALREDLLRFESLVPHAPEVRVPWLLVHGDADEVVEVEHSRDVLAAAGPNAELVELAGADHSFSGDAAARMTEVVVPWIASVFALRS